MFVENTYIPIYQGFLKEKFQNQSVRKIPSYVALYQANKSPSPGWGQAIFQLCVTYSLLHSPYSPLVAIWCQHYCAENIPELATASRSLAFKSLLRGLLGCVHSGQACLCSGPYLPSSYSSESCISMHNVRLYWTAGSAHPLVCSS